MGRLRTPTAKAQYEPKYKSRWVGSRWKSVDIWVRLGAMRLDGVQMAQKATPNNSAWAWTECSRRTGEEEEVVALPWWWRLLLLRALEGALRGVIEIISLTAARGAGAVDDLWAPNCGEERGDTKAIPIVDESNGRTHGDVAPGVPRAGGGGGSNKKSCSSASSSEL